MLRKLLGIGVVSLVVAVLLAGDLTMVAPASVSAAPVAQATDSAGRYLWNYSVKFVCGLQSQVDNASGAVFFGEPVVKPGNYATEINIHNYSYREVKLGKKVLILVTNDRIDGPIGREPKSVRACGIRHHHTAAGRRDDGRLQSDLGTDKNGFVAQ